MDRCWSARKFCRPRTIAIWSIACICFGLIFLAIGQTPAAAQQPPSESACRLCHADHEGTLPLPSGEELSLGVDLAVLELSVHGHDGGDVTCTACHGEGEAYLYPHEETDAASRAEFRAEIGANCVACHTEATHHNPGHLGAQENPAIPTCVDCHGGHDVASAAPMAADPIGTCQSCHQDYGHPQTARVHEELAGVLDKDQDCTTCHNDLKQTPDEQCTTCHTLIQSEAVLASGETIPLHVDLEELARSVHGLHLVNSETNAPLECTDCHVDQQRYGFPHPELTATDLRVLRLEMDDICQTCHTEIFEQQGDSVHAAAQEDGMLVAATCVDCHGNHSIQDPDEPREHVSQTCGNCHSTINEQYEHSVHGAALLGEHNPDVPVCTDCHGVHDIGDPRTAEFRINSPAMCGECHADEEMMAPYGISTNVFDTYVADFHGTTVTLFEKQSPDQETNKAVCYDCHGVHDILPATDENSHVIRTNLLETCRQCHPDADANFPASWTSHFEPSLEHNPLVFLVDWFYRLLIPGVLAGFALFIGSDLFRMARMRRAHKNGQTSHDRD